MRKAIHVPIRIITPKKPHRTDSLFYSGKSIADEVLGNREYVLTTAGEYRFNVGDRGYDQYSRIVRRMNDRTLASWKNSGKLNEDNWGWFGINLWIGGECQDTPTDVYSGYDEAMSAFVKFVESDTANLQVKEAK
jgi:hypothetical protein